MRIISLVIMAIAAAQPAVYWHSSPVPAGGTALFAGAFGNSSAGVPTAFLCRDTNCVAPIAMDTLLAYEGSIAFPYPRDCSSSSSDFTCSFRLCNNVCVTAADPNAPDLWFAMAAKSSLPGTTWAPLPGGGDGSGSGALLVRGVSSDEDSLLRVFGRSLAWTDVDGTWVCVPSTALTASLTTTLVLAPGAEPLPALTASCWEATFNLSASAAFVGAAFPDAQLVTPYGAAALPLTVVPMPPPAALTVIDVDGDAGGSVAAALAAAAAAPGDKLVRLGARAYPQASPLIVPNNTRLEGAGAAASSLVFALNASAPLFSVKGALAGAGDHWALQNFSVVLTSAPAGTPAVWMPPGTVNFTARHLAVTMLQTNVSNAFKIEGARWEVADSAIEQAGVCLWPPSNDDTDFPASVTLLLQGATDGFFRRNSLLWQCAAFDMDVSSRVVFEYNNLTCTQKGVIPHGNSISFYDWAHVPSSVSYSFAHNLQTRPDDNNKTDWAFHETLTTDGPGGWGAGLLGGVDGSTVVVPAGLSTYLVAAGATAVIVAGPGAGQWRAVLSRPNATAVVLAAPFDGNVVVGASRMAIVATVGGKLVHGNSWRWGSVVQEFGTTIMGVFADNHFDHQDNAGADSGAVDGSLTGFGLCYGNEPQQMFFMEYSGNTMSDSNGISLHDASPNSQCNATWPGPYIRWAVIRDNAISGVAPSNPGICGSINASNPGTSDLVVELNTFGCPPGNLLPGNGLNVAAVNSVVV